MSDCGKEHEHAPHWYRTDRGKIKACDGSTSKRVVVHKKES